jgi:hypothetical protein
MAMTSWSLRDSVLSGQLLGDRDGHCEDRGFSGRAAGKKGRRLLDRMVLHRTVTLKRLGCGEAAEKGFWRFLHNERVSEATLIAAAQSHCRAQVSGRRVLAIQDTSEINFSRQKRRKAAFGRGGNGTDPAVFVHPVLAVDAETGIMLGLADIQLWERHGEAPPAATRCTDEKESRRWLDGAEAAAGLRAAGALSVTVIADREGDLYPAFARRPAGAELLVRAQTDRALAEEGYLYAHLDALPVVERFMLALPAIPGRSAREARMELRYAALGLKRPKRGIDENLPESVAVSVVDVREVEAPDGVEPVHWRLLSSAPVGSIADARRAIAQYRRRWNIEQLFRTLKSQGLGLEDSQIGSPQALRKLAILALRAAATCMQLVHARDGADQRPATAAFTADEVRALRAIAPTVDGKTERLRNPFAAGSLPWAAWIIARLGSWSGARNTKPPGPITMHRGLHDFSQIALGMRLRDA